jgi:hypothetical protein
LAGGCQRRRGGSQRRWVCWRNGRDFVEVGVRISK